MKERLAHILKVLLGLVFIVSAILKIVGMDQLELYIYSFHFFSLNQSFLVARAAIILELVLGIGLVGNRLHKPIWWGSVLMLLGYTGFLVYALFLGRTDNCHCFGDVLAFNPWQSLIKNGVLLALFALIYKVNSKPLKHKALALISTVILCGAIVFVVSPPDNYTPNYESSQDLNRELFGEALRQPPMDTLNLAEGKKVVCLFSSSCEICMMAAQKLSLMQQYYNFPEEDVLYVFMGDEESVHHFYQESESTRYSYVIYEDPIKLLKINNGVFPLVIMMENGTIIHEYNFRNMKEEEIKAFFKP